MQMPNTLQRDEWGKDTELIKRFTVKKDQREEEKGR